MRENKVRYIELLSNPVGCGVPCHFSDLLFVQHERVFRRCPCCETAKGRNRELSLDCRVDALRQYWATSTGNQGVALRVLAERRGNLAMAEQALAQITAAFETCRDEHHAPNAAYYERQLPASRALVEHLRKGRKR